MEIGSVNSLNSKSTLDTAKEKVTQSHFEQYMKSAMETKDDKQLKKACQEFEGIIVNMMFKQMRTAIPKSELFPESMDKQIFQSMLDDKLIEEATKERGMGLADVLYKQLSKRLKDTYQPTGGGQHAATVENE